MADVTYNSDSFPELVSTMKSLIDLSPASTPPPMFLLGYKQRHPDERVLWDMAEKQAGVHFVKVRASSQRSCFAIIFAPSTARIVLKQKVSVNLQQKSRKPPKVSTFVLASRRQGKYVEVRDLCPRS